jgi:hypothetical protein
LAADLLCFFSGVGVGEDDDHPQQSACPVTIPPQSYLTYFSLINSTLAILTYSAHTKNCTFFITSFCSMKITSSDPEIKSYDQAFH